MNLTFQESVLLLSAEANNVTILTLALENGAKNIISAIETAIKKDNKEVLEILLKQEGVVKTPWCLYQSVKDGKKEIVRMLLDAGYKANLDHMIHLAQTHRYQEIVEMLENKKGEINGF